MSKKLIVKHELTERGKWLLDVTTKQQNRIANSPGCVDIDGQNCKIGTRCPVCNFRIRGPEHTNGAHHKGIVSKHKGR